MSSHYCFSTVTLLDPIDDLFYDVLIFIRNFHKSFVRYHVHKLLLYDHG